MATIMKKLPIDKKILFLYKFLKRNHYIPNISHPKTFNEKINHRKFFSENELFSICADKVAAKQDVSKAISSNEIIIPTLFSSDTISEDMIRSLLKIHDSFLIKANHNSGHIHFINKNSTKEKIISACNDLSKELRRDFGKRKNEGWYSKIK